VIFGERLTLAVVALFVLARAIDLRLAARRVSWK
jgi:hypothetical protein